MLDVAWITAKANVAFRVIYCPHWGLVAVGSCGYLAEREN